MLESKGDDERLDSFGGLELSPRGVMPMRQLHGREMGNFISGNMPVQQVCVCFLGGILDCQ